MSVAAAWLPGRRASALGPVDAMREGAAGIEPRGQWRPRVGLLVLGIAVGFSGTSVPVRGLAAVLVLLASVLLVPFALAAGGSRSSAARSPTWPVARARSRSCTW